VSAEKVAQSTLPQYTIQVGAYKTRTNASQMASSLSSKGYNTYIKPYLEDGATIFKVHVEKFNSKKRASEFANKLTNKENLSTFITTLNPS
jgi:cell division septation protein DedD